MKKIGIIILSFVCIFIGETSIKAEVYSGGETVKPLGMIEVYSGGSVPSGYLVADGSEVSRTEYKELFQVIGTTYGSGNGSTTFNLPNLMERVVVGQSTNENFKYLGKTGGESSHKLTTAEMPSHTHTFMGEKHKHTFTGTAVTSGNNSVTPSATFTGSSATTSTVANHTHSIPALSGTAASAGSHVHAFYIYTHGANGSTRNTSGTSGTNDGTRSTVAAGAHTHSVTTNASTTGGGGTHSHTVTATGTVSLSNTTHTHSFTAAGTISEEVAKGTNSSTGGNVAHNNMQPYIVLKYIIKAK